jgi:glycosyltransferase involved in cell wall biosynthesis
MEAASMETPIITTDNVGCRDIVDDGKNGFIVEPQNIPSLVNAIEEFIEMDDQDKLVMGKLGRKKMEIEYQESKIFQTYLNTINKYLSSPHEVPNKKSVEQKY